MIINMNGAKAPETSSPVLQEKTVTPETLPTVIGPDEGYDGLSQVTVNPDSQLKAENIRSGKTVFGVTGTFAGTPQIIYSGDFSEVTIGCSGKNSSTLYATTDEPVTLERASECINADNTYFFQGYASVIEGVGKNSYKETYGTQYLRTYNYTDAYHVVASGNVGYNPKILMDLTGMGGMSRCTAHARGRLKLFVYKHATAASGMKYGVIVDIGDVENSYTTYPANSGDTLKEVTFNIPFSYSFDVNIPVGWLSGTISTEIVPLFENMEVTVERVS